MRFSPGLLLLLTLLSPLAHAELIDDVNDRGELRIALPTPRRTISKRATNSPALKWSWVNCWPKKWRCALVYHHR